jgi:hypothetical protein
MTNKDDRQSVGIEKIKEGFVRYKGSTCVYATGFGNYK